MCCSQVKEYKADLVSLREQLKAASAGAAGDAARAELVSRATGMHHDQTAYQICTALSLQRLTEHVAMQRY